MTHPTTGNQEVDRGGDQRRLPEAPGERRKVVSSCDVPAQVSSISLNNYQSVNTLGVTWTNPGGKVDYYIVSVTGAVNNTIRTSIPQAIFRRLLPGREYTVTVQTVSGNCSQTSAPVTEATYPTPPGNINFISITTRNVTLSWSEPAYMKDLNKSYNIIYWKCSLMKLTETSNTTNITLLNLMSGTTYTINVVTVGVRGYQSSPVSKSVCTKPMSVKSPQISNVTSYSVSLMWSYPDEYQISYRVQTNVTSSATMINNIIVRRNSKTIQNLTPGETYTFLVYTRAADWITESDPVSVSTCTVPEQVSSISLNNYQSVNTLGVTWLYPGGKVDYYIVSVTGAVNNTIQTNTTQENFTGLLPGREYTVTVQTVSGDCNKTSAPVMATNATYPTPPGNINFSSITTSNVTLSWSEPVNMSDVNKSYIITYGIFPSTNLTEKSNTTNVTLQNLISGNNYSISVVTVGVRGYQSSPVSSSFCTIPAQVSSISLNNLQVNTLGVTWLYPGGKVDYYIVSVTGAVNNTKQTNTTQENFTGLLPGREYTVTVQTVSGDCNKTSAPVMATNATYPNPPENINFNSITTSNVTLSWSEPVNMINVNKSYIITYGIFPSTNLTVTSNTTNVTLQNLISGNNYSISVVTFGVRGYQSSPVSSSFCTIPEQVSSISLNNYQSVNTLGVTWLYPGGKVDYYIVSVTGAVNNTIQTNTTQENFTGLLPGREYNVTVQTVSGNCNKTSAPVMATNATYPTPPENINFNSITTRNVTLSWSEPVDMTGVNKSYIITYGIFPSTNLTETSNTTNVTLQNLISGNNYSISVVTVGVRGYQSSPVSSSFCTIPAQVSSISLNNYQSVNTLGVTWTNPGGKVDYYIVSVTGAVNNTKQTTTTQVNFTGLLPGREYTVTVQTVSGNCRQTSAPVIEATCPTPPENINFNSITTRNLTLSWSEPVNMTGVNKSYIITYGIFPSTNLTETSNTTNVTLQNLISGNNYSISVVTVGVRGYQSSPVSSSFCTIPAQVSSISLNNYQSVNTLGVTWTNPGGKVDYYIVSVTGAVNNTKQTNTTQENFTGLLPGREYTVTVQTVSGDCRQTSAPVIEATCPTPPENINFNSITTRNLTLSWSEPVNMTGVNKSYIITYGIFPSTNLTETSNTTNVTLQNLISGNNYSISVVTVGVRGYQSSPFSSSFCTIPAQVSSISLNNYQSVNTLGVTWTNPGGKVDYYIVSVTGAVNNTKQTTTTQVNFTGLLPGREYTVTVQTVSGDCRQTSAPVIEATCPTPPENINFNSITTRNLTLSWSEPVNMTGVNKSYIITYGIFPSTNLTETSNTTNVTLQNLISGNNYSISVVTVGVRGYQSSPVSSSFCTIPEQVSSISLNNYQSVNTLGVTWTNPGGKVDYYIVSVTGAVNNTIQTTTTQVNFTGLLPGREYTVTVQTVSGDCNKTSAPVIEATCPTPPENINFNSITTRNLTLSWSEPVNMTGVNKSYIITYGIFPSTNLTETSNTTNVTLQNLISGNNYSISVVTVGVRGYQSSPVSSSFCTIPAQVSSISLNNYQSVNTLGVTWTNPGGKVDYYIVSVTGAVNNTKQTTTTQVNFTGLLPGREYTVTVQTVSGNCRQTSAPVIEATCPTPPENINFNSITTRNLTLSWSEPVNMTGVNKSYIITYGIFPSTNLTETSNTTNVTLQNLISGNNYSISVVTVGVRGYQSSPVSSSFCTIPEQVSSISLNNYQSVNTLGVTWTNPGGKVDFYIVSVTGAVNNTIQTTTTQVNFTGLLPGREYTVTVQTVSGDCNKTSAPVIEATCPTPPENINFNSITTRNLTLSWSEPVNMTGVNKSYIITYGIFPSTNLTETSNTTNVTLQNLISGNNYSISVVTVGVRGYQSSPVSSSFCTIPAQVSSISLNNYQSVNTLGVTWTNPGGKVDYYIVSVTGAVNNTKQTTTTQVNFTGLLPGREYTVTVQTVSGNCRQTSAPMIEATCPTPPENINFNSITTRNLTLSWSEPVNMTGVNKSYIITYGIFPSTNLTETSNTTNVTLQNLISGNNYSISVVTVGVRGYQSSPVSSSFCTIPAQVSSISLNNYQSVNTLGVTWTNPGGKVDYYIVSVTGAVNNTKQTTTTQVNFTGLLPGREYTVTVQTVSGDCRQTSAPVIEATCPTPPENINFNSITTRNLTLSWSEPVNMTGVNKSYIITYGIFPSTNLTETSNTTNVTLQNLISGNNYSISVVTVGVRGYQSSPVSSSFCTIPEQVSSISLNNYQSVNTLGVTWTNPGGKVDYYIVSVTGAVNNTIQTTTTQVNFTGLLPGREYTVTVQTVSGNCRQTSAPVIEATCPTPPENINFNSITTRNLTLSWSEPVNMTGVNKSYIITYGIFPSTNLTETSNTTNVTLQNLISGNNYSISVVTVGVRGYQSSPVSSSFCTIPAQVSSIFLNNYQSVNTLGVTWTNPGGKVGYYIVSVTGAVNNTKQTNTTQVNFTGLLPGREYIVTVQTVSGDCNKTSAPVMATNATYPTPPGNINFNSITTSNVTLSWSEPVNMTGVNKSYIITYGIFPSTNLTETSNTTNVTLQNLISGNNYSISVVTVGVRGYQSSPVSSSFCTIPAQVSSISLNNYQSVNTLGVTWTNPGGKVDYYIVSVTGAVNNTIQTNTTQVNFTGLLPGREYTVTVQTVSGDCNKTSAPVMATNATYPTPPGNINFNSITTRNVTLSWSEPVDMTGVNKSYIITYGIFPSTNLTETSNTTNVTLQNLISGNNYSISVVTVGVQGYQSSPVSSSFCTIPAQVSSISLNNYQSVNTLGVTWTNPGGKVDYYIISVTGAVNNTIQTTTTQVNFTGLLPGREYTVTVQTVSGDCRQTSAPVIEATCPTPPENINFSSITTRNLTLSWSEPVNMTGVNKSYIITYGIFPSTNLTETSNTTNVTLQNLISGSNYSISVVTVGVRGYQSSPVSSSVYTKPMVVTNLLNSSATSYSVSLMWGRPNQYQTSYSYRVQTNVTSSATIINNTIVGSESAKIENLTPGETYTFLVYTRPADNITESDPVSVSTCTVPETVSEFSCSSPFNSSDLNFTWNSPVGKCTGFRFNATNTTSTIADYPIMCSPGGQQNYSMTLNYSTTYNLSVTTLSSCGKSSVMVQKQCTTNISSPIPPTALLVSIVGSPSYTSFTFTFPGFDSSNGRIEAYAVIVSSKNVQGSMPSEDDLLQTYSNFKNKGTSKYVALIKNPNDKTSQRSVRAATTEITVTIGDNSGQSPYINGPLDSGSQYCVGIAGFTSPKWNETWKISPKNSLYSFSPFSQPINTPVNPGPIVGAVLGSILGVLVILLIGFLIWRKRRKGGKKAEGTSTSMKVFQAMTTDNFVSHFMKQKADSNLGFSEEYMKLATVGTRQTKFEADKPENKEKNRYTNVLPYDASRVVLSGPGNLTEDYINANYIPGYSSPKEFIAAQGPLPNTVNDFWRIMWEKDVQAIVMLTRCVELGKIKCEEYWPQRNSKTYGNLSVSMTNECVQPDWTIRDFTIVNMQTRQSKQVRHFHFTAWPDHGVPKTTNVLIQFRNLVREYTENGQPLKSPIVVHCSAGVGRTGTFIALDRVMKQIEAEDKVDVYGIVYDLRLYRGLMVQTESQYIFLNQCTLDIIKTPKETDPDLIYQNQTAILQNLNKPSTKFTKL
ncbi:receptor-type tyrosine-protein phosphatase beta-like [Hyla sarda]|uniref:receptor-type tyrosine-protein phosphatase beta-like n=1 Tax=Hyla sarda TaxID=327740 RepID=UPI0024C39B42|nr:receptor-type tyrosine-protein phosphatase beta-like [Hyla sarda]